MVCYRRPPSSPHIHSARTAQDGSRKRYSYTSIKNHATVSQAALSNFDWQYDTNTLTRSCLTISRYDDPKKKPCSRSTSEIRSFAFDTLRQTRLSDRFLIRRVSIKIFFSFCQSLTRQFCVAETLEKVEENWWVMKCQSFILIILC